MLLAGSGLLIRSFLRLQKQSLGFQTDRVAGVFPAAGSEPISRWKRHDEFPGTGAHSHLKAVPGVESAGAISTLPLSGNDARRPFTVPGQPEEAGRPNIARFRLATPDYFQTMRIPLKRGRPFDERDRTGSAEVVIISEGLARRFWPNEDPVGKIHPSARHVDPCDAPDCGRRGRRASLRLGRGGPDRNLSTFLSSPLAVLHFGSAWPPSIQCNLPTH